MPDQNISVEQITSSLNTRFIGQKVLYYPVVDSTMDAARREALWDARAGTVIIAGMQTAGRGRLDHNWVSPPGNLAFSVILRPNLDFLPFMVMIASLGVINAIRLTTGLRPQIKWPNDILINYKKIAGILIENDIRKNTLHHCVIGIGINVNMNMADYPDLMPIATSLSDQSGKELNRQVILSHCLSEMDSLYQLLPDTESILKQWQKNIVTFGQKVAVVWGDKTIAGVAEGVTTRGNLLLRNSEGKLVEILAGDVHLQT
jgi:BirA family biotin operon repressor/biotin-[acetyl-CoA-carboxylase] ligase